MFEVKVKGEVAIFDSYYDALEYCKRVGLKKFKITKSKFN